MKRKSDIIIGKQCKHYRELLDMTQQEVADILKMSRETVNRFENGQLHSTKILDFWIDNGLEIVLVGGSEL